MKYIIIKAFNQGDWFSKNYCLVKLNDEVIKLLERMEMFTSLFQFDLSLFDSAEFKSFFKFSFEFYDSDEETDPDVIFDFLQSEKDFEIIKLTQEEIEKLELGGVERLDGAHSSIESSHIQFKAYNKYGDGEEIWSESINIKELLKEINA